MIKLTAINYKPKEEAMKRFHDVSEAIEANIFEREIELESNRNIGGPYVEKEFTPPFEFNNDDYIITDFPLRLRKKDIREYKINTDGLVCIETTSDVVYAIRESLDFMDQIFGV